MTDVGYQYASAAYPSPPDRYSRHHDYSSHSQSPERCGRRKESAASLYDHAAAATMASSSMSPPFIPSDFGGVGTGIAYGAPMPHGDNDKNGPLSSLNLGFLKSLTEKKTTRDGQAPKRRGPKPDSKPALTRRQELNRQAQRTHRERKELYIKALEDEVLRLKEIFSNVSQDKDRLADENRALKAMLQQNGLHGLPTGSSHHLDDNSSTPPSLGPYLGSNSSASDSYGCGSGMGHASASSQNTPYTPPPGSALSTSTAMRGVSPGGMSPLNVNVQYRNSHGSAGGPQRNPGIDYDQAGIDFVLKLEKPCMDHLPWLVERSSANGGSEPCGHALMASCPPEPFPELTPDIPFGYKSLPPVPNGNNNTHSHSQALSPLQNTNNRNFSRNGGVVVKSENSPIALDADTANDNGNSSGMRTWQLSKADLATLLEASKRLNLDGEITPVMAWREVLAHPRLGELVERDFAKLSDELIGKVRCYGFGAVMEEFEVRDALESVFSTKPEPLANIVY